MPLEYTKHAAHAMAERAIPNDWLETYEWCAMKLSVDKEADALYLRLDDSPIVESEEVSPGVVLDYNEANEVVGVEMLPLSKRSSTLHLSALQFDTV